MLLTNEKQRVTATLQSAGFMSVLTKTRTSRQIFSNLPNIKCHETPRQIGMETATRIFSVKSVDIPRAPTLARRRHLTKTEKKYHEMFLVLKLISYP